MRGAKVRIAGWLAAGGLVALVTYACGDDGGSEASVVSPDAGSDDASAPDEPDVALPVETCTPNCGDQCADLTRDPLNCGGCGVSCDAGQGCGSSRCLESVAFVMRRIFLGETDRNGQSSSGLNYWTTYGLDIDGLFSPTTPSAECAPRAGASDKVRIDGVDGIDNNWGSLVQPALATIDDAMTRHANEAIAAGGKTPVFQLLGWPAPLDATGLAGGLVTAVQTDAGGLGWDGGDVRAVSTDSLVAGAPRAAYVTASVTGLDVASGDPTGAFYLDIQVKDAPVRLPIRRARVRMTISADRTSATGVLGGVVAVQDFKSLLDGIAGYASTSLCPPSDALTNFENTVAAAADILVDGTQDPNVECNAISFGMGFEAVRVELAAPAEPPAPPADPCAM